MSFFALVAIFIWVASEGNFAGTSALELTTKVSKAPTHLPELDLPDPFELNDIEIVPAAHAATTLMKQSVTVRGVMVNLRAGPGLNYRMIDVAEQGDRMEIAGAAVGSWAPVLDLSTGTKSWVYLPSVELQGLDPPKIASPLIE